MREKYLVVGLLWALKRMGLVLLIIAATLFSMYLMFTCFPAFMVELVFIGIILMTLHKARDEYWNHHKEYPTMEKLISEVLNKGPQQ